LEEKKEKIYASTQKRRTRTGKPPTEGTLSWNIMSSGGASSRIVLALREQITKLRQAQHVLLRRLNRQNAAKWESYWQQKDLPPWDPDRPCSHLTQLLASDSAYSGDSLKSLCAVDLGCGSGSNAVHMSRLGIGRVAGVDISQAGLECARRRERESAGAGAAAAAVDWMEADVYKLPMHKDW
jgi:SAM-dependent methyltransferase